MSSNSATTTTTTTASNSTTQASQFSLWITQVEYCGVFLVYSMALQFMVRILWALYTRVRQIRVQEKNGLSNLLITNIICWTILLATALPHIAWMIVNWRPETRHVSAYFLYWSTITTQCMMPVIPFSVFFLTLDRIFSIQWLTSYRERHKLALLFVCVSTLAVIFVGNLVVYDHIMPLPELTECNVFACLMTNGNHGFIVSKLVGAVLIVLSGAYFMYKLRKRRTGIRGPSNAFMAAGPQTSKIEANMLVGVMLTTEMVLNFVPQLIVLVIQDIVGHSIAAWLGPHNLSLNAAEALITALLYRHSLKRFINHNNNSSNSVHVGHSQQQQHIQQQKKASNGQQIRNINVTTATGVTAAGASQQQQQQQVSSVFTTSC